MYDIPEYKGRLGRTEHRSLLLPNSRRTRGTAIMALTGLPLNDAICDTVNTKPHRTRKEQTHKASCDEPHDEYYIGKIKTYEQNTT